MRGDGKVGREERQRGGGAAEGIEGQRKPGKVCIRKIVNTSLFFR